MSYVFLTICICISLLITTACILLISNNIPQQLMVSLMSYFSQHSVHTHTHFRNFHTPHLYKYAPHYYDFCYHTSISMLKPYHCLKYSRCTCREICLLFTTFRLHIISKIIIKCMFSNIFCINFKYGSTNIFHWKWKEII